MRKKNQINRIDKFNTRINDILEIPKEISSCDPKFTITGFHQILIENYKCVLEYEDYYIKINTYIGIININGFDLNLKQITSDDIMICGKIDSIDFESEIEE